MLVAGSAAGFKEMDLIQLAEGRVWVWELVECGAVILKRVFEACQPPSWASL